MMSALSMVTVPREASPETVTESVSTVTSPLSVILPMIVMESSPSIAPVAAAALAKVVTMYLPSLL